MIPSLLAALVALCTLATAARADVPYWQARSGFLPFVRAIAVDPSDPDVVYVGASNGATYYGEFGSLTGTGIFRSTDGGYTWSERNVGLTSKIVTSLLVNPDTPNVLLAGILGAGVFKSVNAGLSWFAVNAGLTNLAVYTMAFDPTNPSTAYVGCEHGGLFRSINGGVWTPTNSLANSTVHAIAIDAVTPSTIYVATDAGVRKSIDGGASFVGTGPLTIQSPGGNTPSPVTEVHAILIDATDSATLLAGTHQGGGVFRSTDAGATWTHTSTGLLSEFGNWRFVNVLAQDPLSPGVFYASSTDGTYRSHDGGLTWALFNAGLSREELYAFGVHPSGAIYTGSVFGEFHHLSVRVSGVNHFRCFKAHAKGFTPQPLTMTDRFGTFATIALKPVRYCTPTDPMGEGVVDPTAHLVCYKVTHGSFPEQFVSFLSQRIDGFRAYRVRASETICLPATAGVPAAAPRDAYRCATGPHWSSYPIDFSIADAFGSQLIRQQKLDRLCVPTDLDGAGENRIESDLDLRCDSVKGEGDFTRRTVTTTDRFGTLTLSLTKPDSHCFQALESRD